VGEVPNKADLLQDPRVRVFQGRGRTLMSGLGDGHAHFTWNGGDLNRLGELDVEEHVLVTVKSARCFLDSGYTMCIFSFSSVYFFPLVNMLTCRKCTGALVPQRQKIVWMW
jgi:hypothetical protein